MLIITGPTGAGKTTIAGELAKRGYKQPISDTTRPIRTGEVNGKDYWFITIEEFEENILEGRYLEYADVYGNYYGTPVNIPSNSVLVLDNIGAKQIIKIMKSTAPHINVITFHITADKDTLIDRATKRGDNIDDITRLVTESLEKFELDPDYQPNHVMVNNDIAETVHCINALYECSAYRGIR